jgi:hypothetical protein
LVCDHKEELKMHLKRLERALRFANRMSDGDGGGGEGGTGDAGGGEGPSVDDLQKQLADITGQFEAVKAKNEELLSETKASKAAKREAEEAARKAAEEQARKDGDFEQLHASSEAARKQLQEQLESLSKGIAEEKRDAAALKLAGELAEGANIELLATFISGRLKYKDGGIKVTDNAGQLTVSSLADLKAEFQSDARYASLLKGNQSSGGGASGGSSGGGAAKQMSRADFDGLAHNERAEFLKKGGKVTD